MATALAGRSRSPAAHRAQLYALPATPSSAPPLAAPARPGAAPRSPTAYAAAAAAAAASAAAAALSPRATAAAPQQPPHHALLASLAAHSDLHFELAPPRLGASATEMDAEVEALRGALARGARECAAARSAPALYSLSRLIHGAFRHAGAARRFYEAHAQRSDRAHQWASRALAVARALRECEALVASLAPTWVRVGPDACDDVWWETEGAPASWVIPLHPLQPPPAAGAAAAVAAAPAAAAGGFAPVPWRGAAQ